MNKNKTMIVALMAILTTAFSNPVTAMDKKSDPPGVEIRYVGFVSNNPVFEITTRNAVADNFIITIRDESGSLLYSEKISGKNLTRKYRIDTEEEIRKGGLRFEVRSVNSKKTQVYTVGMTESIMREMGIVKVQ